MLDANLTVHDGMYLAFVRTMREVNKLKVKLSVDPETLTVNDRATMVDAIIAAVALTELGQQIYARFRDEGVLRVVVEHDELIDDYVAALIRHDEVVGADRAGKN